MLGSDRVGAPDSVGRRQSRLRKMAQNLLPV